MGLGAGVEFALGTILVVFLLGKLVEHLEGEFSGVFKGARR